MIVPGVQYQQIPIRLQLSTASAPPVSPIDANTGNQPAFWRGQSIAVQVGIFDASSNPVDISNLASISLAIQDGPSAIYPLATSTITANDFENTTVSWQEWVSGDGQQVEFDLTPLQTDAPLGGSASLTYWLVVTGLTSGGEILTYGAGPVTIYNPGTQIPFPVPNITSYHEQANTSGSGSSIITPTSPIHTERIDFSGSAGVRNVVVSANGNQTGAQIDLKLTFPTSLAGLQINVYNGSVTGTRLAYFYSPGDGSTGDAYALLKWNASSWETLLAEQPANDSGT